MASETSKPAASGADRPRKTDHVGALIGAENIDPALDLQPKIPPRAALARRFPGLHVNRLSWAWCDDRTGARGYDRASLLEFLAKGAR